MPRPVSAVIRFARQTGQLVALAWHAQPACFIGVLVLNVTQGLVPVATAWVTKLLFDLLAQALPRQHAEQSGRQQPRCPPPRGTRGAGAAPPSRHFTRFPVDLPLSATAHWPKTRVSLRKD